MADITFVKGKATKIMPESFRKQMEADDWKEDGKATETLQKQIAAETKKVAAAKKRSDDGK